MATPTTSSQPLPPPPPQRPTFLTNCINVGLFARIRQRRTPTNTALRQESEQHLEQVATFMANWADTIADSLAIGGYDSIVQRIHASKAVLQTTLASWQAKHVLDADDYYDGYIASSTELFKLCCQLHDVCSHVFYEAVQISLAQAVELLVLDEKRIETDPKTLATDITENYKISTKRIAKLIEGMGLLEQQPTTDPSYKEELSGLADAFAIENELMADIINDMNARILKDPMTIGDPVRDLVSHFSDVKMFASDLTRSVNERLADIRKKNSFADYEVVIRDSENYFATCKETMLDELANVDIHGTLAALQAAHAVDSLSAAAQDVVKGSDEIEKGLAKAQFAIALEENIPDLIDVVENLQPILSKLPQKISTTAAENITKLNKTIEQTRRTIAEQNLAICSAIDLLEKVKTEDEEKQWEAVMISLEYPNLLIDLLNALSFEADDVLFNNDETFAFRELLQDLTDSINAAHKSMHQEGSGAPLSVVLAISAVLSRTEEPLKAFKNFFDGNAAAELAVLEDIKTKSPNFVRTTTSTLVDATNSVMSDGLADGRDVKLLNACRRLSSIVDVSHQLCTPTEYVGDAEKLENTLPSLGYLKQSDVLETVRVIYAMPELHPDEEPQTLIEKKYRVGKGIVKRQVIRIEDGDFIKQIISKLRVVGKLGDTIWSEMEKKHKLELIQQASQGGKAGQKAQEQLRKMGITKAPIVGLAKTTKSDKPKVMKMQKAFDESSIQMFHQAILNEIYNEKGKALTELDPATKQTMVLAGTVNQLVIYLTLPECAESSPNFQAAFLMTMQTFIQPAVFLKKMIERYQVPPCPPGSDQRAYDLAYRYPIQLRVYDIIKLWLSHRGHQDIPHSEEVTTLLNKFIDEYVDRQSKNVASNLRRCYLLCVHHERFLESQRWAKLDRPIYKEFKVAGAPLFQEMIQMFDVRKVAQQITLMDATVLRAITLDELNNQQWMRPESSSKSPRLVEMITQTNRLAVFVAHAILMETTVRGRRKVMSKMISLAVELHRLRNFHSLFGVIAGLQSLPVRRLAFTLHELPSKAQKALGELSALASASNDFSVYRNVLSTCEIPAVPFMGVLLLDLAVVGQSYWSTVNLKMAAGQVDWPSREELAKHGLASLVSFQRECHYKYEMDPLLLTSVLNIMDEYQCAPAELFQQSLTVEPPNAFPAEKKGFQGLRSVLQALGELF